MSQDAAAVAQKRIKQFQGVSIMPRNSQNSQLPTFQQKLNKKGMCFIID